MMISTKLTLQSYTLVLIVFTIFTVSLTETIQISDGFSSEAKKLVFKMQIGETKAITWGLVNEKLEPIDVEVYAEGPGSELMVMERYVTIPPQTRVEYEIFVIVPPDHEDNVEFHPSLFALKRGFLEEGQTGAVVNMRMKTMPIIEIGDNPIYTPSEAEILANTPGAKANLPDVKTTEERAQVETLEEKLARIQEANKAKEKPELKIDDTFEESFEDIYVEEPTADPELVAVQEEKIECDFFAMILSWFGFGKC